MGTPGGVLDVPWREVQRMKLALASGVRSQCLVTTKEQRNQHRPMGVRVTAYQILEVE